MRSLLVLGLLCLPATAIAEPANSPKHRTIEQKSAASDRQKQDPQARDTAKIGRSPQCEGTPGSKMFPACF